MKKLLLAAALCAGSFMSAHASYIYFYNFTGCTYTLNVDGQTGSGGGFSANAMTVLPGITQYTNPSLLPGVTGGPGIATGHVQVVKGYDVGGPYTFVVGITPAIPTLPTSYNSTVNSYFPVCHSGTAYVVTFSQNSNYDVIVTFL